MSQQTQAKLETLLAEIAHRHLYIETLETRRSDRLDFHYCAVWCIKEALIAAYEAGLEQGTVKGRRAARAEAKADEAVEAQ